MQIPIRADEQTELSRVGTLHLALGTVDRVCDFIEITFS